ncbi:MAG: very short patch repair endonuclease [Euryarchaeota archaeon]|nr:very short patch repair endonuclease [Euryarchaeota archaeon]
MSSIRGRDTGPERRLRSALRERGVSYRSYPRLPGRPDLVLPGPKVAVLVHGCFWHGCPRHYVAPRTRARFWSDKLASNRERDTRVARRLRARGWRVAVVWECDLEGDPSAVVGRLLRLAGLQERPRRSRHRA